jgi:hypothetical protein
MFCKQIVHPELIQSTSPSLHRRKKHSHRRRRPPGSHHQCDTAIAAFSPRTPYRPWVYPTGGQGGGHAPHRIFGNLYLPRSTTVQSQKTRISYVHEPTTSGWTPDINACCSVLLLQSCLFDWCTHYFPSCQFFSYFPVNYFFSTYY